MAANKPLTYALWNPSQSGVVQPPDTLRARGYQANESPLAQHINWLFWLNDQWTQYFDQSLTSAVMTTTLDSSMRLMGGGTLTYSTSSQSFTWSQALYLSIPSIADADNQIAAGNVLVQPGQVLFVQANVPFTSLGDVTTGTATVQNVAYTAGIAAGQAVTGAGIVSGTTVVSVSGTTVTLSQNATATSQQTPLTYAGTGALTVQAANVASLVPSANTVILGRATATALYLGVNSGQVILRDAEQRRLLEAGYHDVRYLIAGASLTARQAVYLSSTADGRTQGTVYPTDSSQQNGAQRAACVGFVTTAVASGATASIMTGGVLGGFTGLQSGTVYYLDPANLGGITVTKPSGGNYAVPVGYAIDANTLYVRISSASGAPTLDPSYNAINVQPVSGDTNPTQLTVKDASGNIKASVDASGNVTGTTFTSGSGFKTMLGSMVYQGNVAAGQSLGAVNSPLNLLESTLQSIYTCKMPYTGSFIGMSINYRYTATQSTAPTFYILPTLNGSASLALNPNFTGGQNGGTDYAFSASQNKGINKFAVNDGLGAQFYTSTFPTACTVYLRVALWVEVQG